MKERAIKLARRLKRLRRLSEMPIEDIRDFVDQATNGELDCFQLDFLTDLVIDLIK